MSDLLTEVWEGVCADFSDLPSLAVAVRLVVRVKLWPWLFSPFSQELNAG